MQSLETLCTKYYIFAMMTKIVNSRVSDDIGMKLGPVTKRDKRKKTLSKNLTMTSYQQIATSLSFFQFMANSEKSRSRIPDAQSEKLTFSLKVTFYLTKTENRTKKSLTQFSHHCFEGRHFFTKKADSLRKNADIDKIKRALALKDIFL